MALLLRERIALALSSLHAVMPGARLWGFNRPRPGGKLQDSSILIPFPVLPQSSLHSEIRWRLLMLARFATRHSAGVHISLYDRGTKRFAIFDPGKFYAAILYISVCVPDGSDLCRFLYSYLVMKWLRSCRQ